MKTNFNNIKKTGFKTPDNYFDAVEDNIMNAIKKENSLNISKETGFITPEKYFDTIEDVIINKIEKKNTTKVITLFSKRNLIYASSIAAAILIMFGIYLNKDNDILEEIEYEIVENYILNQGISSYDIASLLTEEELSNINFEIMDEAFNNEDIEDYLLENANLEDIIEQ